MDQNAKMLALVHQERKQFEDTLRIKDEQFRQELEKVKSASVSHGQYQKMQSPQIEDLQAFQARAASDQMTKLVDIYKQEAEKTRIEMESIKTSLIEIQKKNQDKEAELAEKQEKAAKEAQNMANTYSHFIVDKANGILTIFNFFK